MSAEDLPGVLESAILVPVPEAEPVVGQLRARLDRSAGRGIPAHVTVLYPFVPPGQLTPAVIEMAAAAVKSVPGFGCRFAGTDWFGEDVLWLAPEPAGPFRALTAAVHAAFPQYPPFGGAFADVIPHLTVGDRPEDGIGALRAAEAEVLPMLPVRTHVSHAWLMTGSRAPGSWQLLAAFPLGQRPSGRVGIDFLELGCQAGTEAAGRGGEGSLWTMSGISCGRSPLSRPRGARQQVLMPLRLSRRARDGW